MHNELYLISVRKCNNNSAVKYVKNFHKIINQFLVNGWLLKDPFVNYKAKVKEVIREFLSKEAIERIMEKKIVSKRLEFVYRTQFTSNLSAVELENYYGNRV